MATLRTAICTQAFILGLSLSNASGYKPTKKLSFSLFRLQDAI